METIKKELSIGTIITDGQYILGCRPYGRKDQEHSYDLPKGHWEEGETYIETAVRECKEETDFDLWPDHLVDLGKYEYIPTKDLYIFLVALDFMPELSSLKCTTYFEQDGKKVPEIVSYKLIPITQLQWFFKSLEPIVRVALENFDKRIEEDENATVALPQTIEEGTRPFLEKSDFTVKSTSSEGKLALEEDVYTKALFPKRCKDNEYIYGLLGNPDGEDSEAGAVGKAESLKRHINNYLRLGARLDHMVFVDWDPNVVDKLRAALKHRTNYFGVQVVQGDFRDVITEAAKTRKIYLADYDGTSPFFEKTNLDFLRRYIKSPLSRYLIMVGESRTRDGEGIKAVARSLNIPTRPRVKGGVLDPASAPPTKDILPVLIRKLNSKLTPFICAYRGRGRTPMLLLHLEF